MKNVNFKTRESKTWQRDIIRFKEILYVYWMIET